MTPYQMARDYRILMADRTPDFDRVKFHDGPLIKLDWATGVAAPYQRQQRRSRDREEAREPSFSDRLVFALGQIEWLPPALNWTGGFAESDGVLMASMGLMSTSPRSSVINRRVKRYRAAYLSERQEPSADYSERYKALFTVHESPAIHQG